MVAKSQIPGQGSASAHPCPDFKHWWLAFWAQALRSVPLGSAACGSLVLLITAWSLGRAAAFLASPECLRIGCSVSFESRPPDAMVWIDDHYAGRTPQDATGLCRGWHLLRMEKRGFQAVIRSVYVGRREQSLSVELSPFPVATLACESVPISAEVSVDGRVLGETPLEVPFRTGLHQVHFAAEGYAAWQQEVELAAGETKRVRAALRSRLETFLLDRVAAEPWRVGYAYDLAHQDLLAGRDDRALGVLERGLRAAADPRAPTGEAARLVQEINYIYQGQFKFGTPESLRGLQARLVELVERVARELPRNTYAGALLGSLYTSLGRDEDAPAVYRAAHQAVRSARAKRYFAQEAVDALRGLSQRKLAMASSVRQEAAQLSGQARSAEQAKAANAAEMSARAAEKEQAMKALYAECLGLLEQAAAEFVSTDLAADCLLQAAQVRLHHLADAEAYVGTLHALIARFPASTRAPACRRQLAEFFFGRRELARCIEEYRAYLKDYPGREETMEVRSRLAQCWIEAGDKAQAVQELEALLAAAPDRPAHAAVLAQLIDLCRDLHLDGKADGYLQLLLHRYAYTPEAEKRETDPARQKQRQVARERLAGLGAEQASLHALKAKHASLDARARQLGGNGEAGAEAARREAAEALDALHSGLESLLTRYQQLVDEFRSFAEARTAQADIIQLHQAFSPEPDSLSPKTLEACRAFIERFPSDPRSASFRQQVSQSLVHAGEKEQAIAEWRKCIAQFPGSPGCAQAQLQIISLCSSYRGYEERERYVEELERFVKDFPSDEQTATMLFTLGLTYYYQSYPGDREKAVEVFRRLDQAFPQSALAIQSEYYRAHLDDGMQREESAADSRVAVPGP